MNHARQLYLPHVQGTVVVTGKVLGIGVQLGKDHNDG